MVNTLDIEVFYPPYPAARGFSRTELMRSKNWQRPHCKRRSLDLREFSRQRGGFNVRTCLFEMIDRIGAAKRQSNVIQAFHQPPAGVVINLESSRNRTTLNEAILQVNGDFSSWVIFQLFPDQLDIRLVHLCSNQTLFAGV